MSRQALVTLGLFWLLAAPAAEAGPPLPSLCTLPPGIQLVGTGAGGAADPAGAFLVILRDGSGAPENDRLVTVDFTDCATVDIRLGSAQSAPGVSLDCADKTVSALSDFEGIARFTIVGAAHGGGGSPAAGTDCAKVSASVFLGSVTVAAFDQNGMGGVDGADVVAWLSDRFDADYEGRSDFNFDGQVDARDLIALLAVRFGNGSSASSAAYCP